MPTNSTFKNKKCCKNNTNFNSLTSNIQSLNYENNKYNNDATTISRYTSNRISMISNVQSQTIYATTLSNKFYIYLGDYTYTCQCCGALFWFNERSKESTLPKFNLCCINRKIKIPLLKETSTILNNLLNYNGGRESTFYRKNIRTLNSMLAFTSYGANIDSSTSDSHSPSLK